MECVKGMTLRKTLSIAVLIGVTALGANAFADPPQGASGPGYGMGPGMMGSGGMGPGVIARMEQNMRSSRLSVPDDNQIRQIVAFLEQHASSSK